MLNKRIILIFLTLITFKVYSESKLDQQNIKIIEDQYNSLPDNFFVEGIISIENQVSSFQLYQEKNSFFTSQSITVENQLLKSKSDEYFDLFSLNNGKIIGTHKFLNTFLPLEILNFPLRNREYTILEKAIVYKYKNLKANKILIIDKKNEIKEFTNTYNEESIIDNSYELDVVVEETPFESNKYEKLIYTIAEGSNIILKKEFFLNENDRIAKFIYEVENIKYIDGYYIPVEWYYSDSNKSNTLRFKYDTNSIVYTKEKVPNEFSKMATFYGVR